MLADPRDLDPAEVRRVLICSGKIFYALDSGREERDWHTIAIIRLEQLYPFPAADLAAALRHYPAATQFQWVQEEPANQGAWSFVRWRIEELLDPDVRLRYVGRREAASPATGSHKIHQAEEAAIVEAALRRPRERAALGRRTSSRESLRPPPEEASHVPADVLIPELGESITDGVIVRWLKDDGAVVRADEPLLELETDKATVEIPATVDGRLQIVEQEGATVRVGAVVARIVEDTAAPAPSTRPAPRPTPRQKASAGTPLPPTRSADHHLGSSATRPESPQTSIHRRSAAPARTVGQPGRMSFATWRKSRPGASRRRPTSRKRLAMNSQGATSRKRLAMSSQGATSRKRLAIGSRRRPPSVRRPATRGQPTNRRCPR